MVVPITRFYLMCPFLHSFWVKSNFHFPLNPMFWYFSGILKVDSYLVLYTFFLIEHFKILYHSSCFGILLFSMNCLNQWNLLLPYIFSATEAHLSLKETEVTVIVPKGRISLILLRTDCSTKCSSRHHLSSAFEISRPGVKFLSSFYISSGIK